MAEFYCDLSAVGNEYAAYADTPTPWGVPQDGNGKAGPGHAAAVGIATINCASASASGAGQLFVMGQSVSATLTGSGATLATNIVTAINASATATTATYSALLLPVNRLVYARVNPGLSTEVQIMMRIAGTDWSALPPTTAGTWAIAPTITGFTGGANGPFGYITNAASVFGRNFGAGYGIWFNAPASVTAPGTSDVVHVRTARSTADIGIEFSYVATYSVTWQSRNYLYDNGSVWAGDNGMLEVTITNAHTSAITLLHSMSGVVHESREKYNLSVILRSTGNSGGNIQFNVPGGNGQHASWRRCLLSEGVGNIGTTAFFVELTNRTTTTLDLTNSKISLRNSGRVFVQGLGASASYHSFIFDGLDVEYIAASGALGSFFQFAATSLAFGSVRWIGGSVYDTNGVYTCASPLYLGTGATVAANVLIKNVAGVTDPSLSLVAGLQGSQLLWDSPNAFRLETNYFVADWKDTGFPYLTAQNLFGAYWSHRITWKNTTKAAPLIFDYQYREASGIKTVKLELYVQDATTLYADEIGFAVSYTDSDNIVRNEEIGDCVLDALLTRSAIASSAATWVANGVGGYSPKKLEITTQHAVKQNSQVVGRLTLNSAKAVSIVFYVSPELVIS